MATTLRAALAEVLPTADSTDNNNMSDVVGNKTDTVAGSSLISLTKLIDQNVDTINNSIDIPSIDSTANLLISDVIGNKSDTALGTSIISITKAIAALSTYIKDATDKIDGLAVSGLSGVNNSLAYKVHEIEKHFHNSAQWFGKDGGDNLLNRDSVTPWALVAGTSQAYGTEVQLSDGTEVESGSATKKFDLHEILIVDNDAGNAVTTYKIQFWYGTGLFAAATLLTECVCSFYSVSDNHGVIVMVCPRITCNNKLWARVKCSVNSKSLSFIMGVHTYVA